MRLFKLAMQQLKREWRSGELYVLFFAVVIAVAAVSSVNFFTDRIHRALLTQANELLGADLVLNSDHKFSEYYFQQAEQLGLKTVRQLTFPTMVMHNDNSQLVWLKAVDEDYPLRGNLGISQTLFAPETTVQHMVANNKVWIEPRLVTSLEINPGDTIQLGHAAFEIDALLTTEPGRGGNLFNIAPRVLLNYDDIQKTKLIQPGSRVRYALLIAGDTAALAQFRKLVTEKKEAGITLQGIQDARPEIRVALSRAEQFLGLAALTSLILAGVAIALAARRFSQRHLDHCAIMRCVGATQSMVSQLFVWQILMLGLIASVLGTFIGFFSHQLLIDFLGVFVGVALPSPGLLPFVFGLLTGMVTLAGFALPPVFALKKVPALRVLKRDLGALNTPRVLTSVLGIAALAFVMMIQARDFMLGVYLVLGVLAAIALLALLSYSLLFIIRLYNHKFRNPWLFGLRNLTRRSASSVVQIVAFGLGIMALLLLTSIRGDLLDDWQTSIPADAPNRFVINIHPSQVPAMEDFFHKNNVPVPPIYPMIRGRLVALNDVAVSADDYENRSAKQMISREFNLSWSATLAEDNKILEGEWWHDGAKGQELISIEESVAKNLNIKLGDVVKFKVADRFFQAKIASIREVDWGSFRANFYAVTNPGLLDDFPTTYMTPFYLAPERYELLNQMVKTFSNITVIDIAAVIGHVREIINRVTLAVEYVFIFTILSGVMVLFAGIQSTHDERMLENAIIRTIGGRKKQILQTLIAEFACLGIFAGLIAAIMATIIAMLISHFVLKMPYHWNVESWFYGMLGGGLGVGLIGVWGSSQVLKIPPLATLRKISVTN